MIVEQIGLSTNRPIARPEAKRARLATRLGHYCTPTWTGISPSQIGRIRIPATPVLAFMGAALAGYGGALTLTAGAEMVGSTKKIVDLAKLSAAQKRAIPKPTFISRAVGMGMVISGSLLGVANAATGAAVGTPILRLSAALLLIGLITLAVDKLVRLISAPRVAREIIADLEANPEAASGEYSNLLQGLIPAARAAVIRKFGPQLTSKGVTI